MSYPHFIAIDPSSYEDDAHPIAIAWSMADGQIKTTLIQPEDDWDDWDYAIEDIHGINQDTLYQRGETLWSVIRELENDLEQPYLIGDDEPRIEQLLEKMYDACHREPTLEISSFGSENLNAEVMAEVNEALFQQQLPCDERVLVMLRHWAMTHQPQPTSESVTSIDNENDAY